MAEWNRRTQLLALSASIAEQCAESHRRYLPPQSAQSLLAESGFERIRWVRAYDVSTLGPIQEDSRPGGPFMVIAEL